MKQGVLLVAHGAPERVEDVEEYLGYVRGGRPGSPEVLAEVRSRYIAIGGGSPLLRWTRAQAAALERLLGLPVFFGMRNWHPFLREAMDRVREAGIDKLAAVCLAPQFSDLSVGLYIRRTREAATEAGVTAEIVWAKSYHTEPLLIESYAERLRPLLPAERMLFTAHSLPQQALAADDPYEAECRATAAGVASSAGIAQWDFAFQSQGLSGGQWLGPTVESCLDRYAAAGVREVVLCPVGFVADHVEVLFDIDILFREYAAARGIELRRPESLNDSATFTAALAEVAKRCL
jgi:ferrochelatase